LFVFVFVFLHIGRPLGDAHKKVVLELQAAANNLPGLAESQSEQDIDDDIVQNIAQQVNWGLVPADANAPAKRTLYHQIIRRCIARREVTDICVSIGEDADEIRRQFTELRFQSVTNTMVVTGNTGERMKDGQSGTRMLCFACSVSFLESPLPHFSVVSSADVELDLVTGTEGIPFHVVHRILNNLLCHRRRSQAPTCGGDRDRGHVVKGHAYG
jgi:hypothetical protein